MPRFPLPENFADGDVARFKKNFERVLKTNGWDDSHLAALPLVLVGR